MCAVGDVPICYTVNTYLFPGESGFEVKLDSHISLSSLGVLSLLFFFVLLALMINANQCENINGI